MTEQHRPDRTRRSEGRARPRHRDQRRRAGRGRHPRRMGVAPHDDPPADRNRPAPDQPGRPGRAAGQGHAHRLDGQAAARRGAQRPARREGPRPPGRDPPALDRRARGRPGPRAGRGARADHPALPGRLPSDAELRIAQAQLVGWLEGLFHGIQTALVAQQMAAQAQLQQIDSCRRAPATRGCRRPVARGCPSPSARSASRATPRAPASTSDPNFLARCENLHLRTGSVPVPS